VSYHRLMLSRLGLSLAFDCELTVRVILGSAVPIRLGRRTLKATEPNLINSGIQKKVGSKIDGAHVTRYFSAGNWRTFPGDPMRTPVTFTSQCYSQHARWEGRPREAWCCPVDLRFKSVTRDGVWTSPR